MMARINDANIERYLDDEVGPEPDATGLEIHLLETELAELVERRAILEFEIRRLRDEDAYRRAMFSSRRSVGTIKPALHTNVSLLSDGEDLL